MPETWQCPLCETVNSHGEALCQACHALKPTAPAAGSSPAPGKADPPTATLAPWTCAECETVNSAMTLRCDACRTPKSGRRAGRPDASRPGSTKRRPDTDPVTPAMPEWTIGTGAVPGTARGFTAPGLGPAHRTPHSGSDRRTPKAGASRPSSSVPPRRPASSSSPPKPPSRPVPPSPEPRWEPPPRYRPRRRRSGKIFGFLALLAAVGGIFLTRQSWEPVLNGNSSSQPSANNGGSTSSTTACPANAAATIPGGDNSTLIDAYQTTGFYVTLCSTTSGDDYYFGMSKQDTSQQITLPVQEDNGTYTATNNGYTYQVTGQDLIVSRNGQTLLDQALSPAS